MVLVKKKWMKLFNLFLVLLIILPSFVNIRPPVVIAAGEGIFASDVQSTFIREGEEVKVDPELTLAMTSMVRLDQVTIVINNVKDGDTLSFSDQNGIVGEYNEDNGVLTLKGSALIEEYEEALREVAYSTTSSDLDERQVTIKIGNAHYFEVTQHFYEFVPAPGITWKAAKAAAEEKEFFGRQGYLATITSAEENNFVEEKMVGQGWIGASDEHATINDAVGDVKYSSQDASEGQWHWVTGPEKGMLFWQGAANGSTVDGNYQNWNSDEPNNNGGEHYARGGSSSGDYDGWNNTSNEQPVDGYIVEYGGLDKDNIPNIQIIMSKTINILEVVEQTEAPEVKETEAKVSKVKKTETEASEVEEIQTKAPDVNQIVANATDQTVSVSNIPADSTVTLYRDGEEPIVIEKADEEVIFTDVILTEGEVIFLTFTEVNKNESEQTAVTAQVRSDAVDVENVLVDESINKLIVKDVPAYALIKVYQVDTDEIIAEFTNSEEITDSEIVIAGLDEWSQLEVSITKQGQLESKRVTIDVIQASSGPFFNAGFEKGLDGWELYGSVSTGIGDVYHTDEYAWTVNPYETQMAVLVPSGSSGVFPQVVNTLMMSQESRDYISANFPNTTNFAYIYQDIELEANEEFEMSWNYVATDYEPFNDASFVSLVNLESDYTPIINSYKAQVNILGATNLGTGNYSTGSYGSTGWQTATFKVEEAGTYRLGFATFNLADTALNPYLFVDQKPGETFKDGEPFAPIPKDPNAPTPPGPAIPNANQIIANATDGTVTIGDVPGNTVVKLYKDGQVIDEIFSEPGGTVIISNLELVAGENIEVTFTEESKEESLAVSKIVQNRTDTLNEKDIVASATTNTVVIQHVPAGAIVNIYDEENELIGQVIQDGESKEAVIEIEGGLNDGDYVHITMVKVGELESHSTLVTATLDMTPAPNAEDIIVNAEDDKIVISNVPVNTLVKVYKNGEEAPIVSKENAGGTVTFEPVPLEEGESVQITYTFDDHYESDKVTKEAQVRSGAVNKDYVQAIATTNVVTVQNVPSGASVFIYTDDGESLIGYATNEHGDAANIDIIIYEKNILKDDRVMVSIKEVNQLESEKISAKAIDIEVSIKKRYTAAGGEKTDSVYENVEERVLDLVRLLEEDNKDEELIDKAVALLQEALESLENAAIEKELANAIVAAEEALKAGEEAQEHYTDAGGEEADEVYQKVEEAKQKLESALLLDPIAIEEVKERTSELEEAIAALEKEREKLEAINAAEAALKAGEKAQERYTDAGGEKAEVVYQKVEEAKQKLESVLLIDPIAVEEVKERTSELEKAIVALDKEREKLEAIAAAEKALEAGTEAQEHYTDAGGEEADELYQKVEEAKQKLELVLLVDPIAVEEVKERTSELEEAIAALDKEREKLEAINAAKEALKAGKEGQERYTHAGGEKTDVVHEVVEELKKQLQDELAAVPQNIKQLNKLTKELITATVTLNEASKERELVNAIVVAEEALKAGEKAQEHYTDAGGEEADELYQKVEEAKQKLESAILLDPIAVEEVKERTSELEEAIAALEKEREKLEAINAAEEALIAGKEGQERYTHAGGEKTDVVYEVVEELKKQLQDELAAIPQNIKQLNKLTKELITATVTLNEASKERELVNAIAVAEKVLEAGTEAQERYTHSGGEEADEIYQEVEAAKKSLEEILVIDEKNIENIEEVTRDLEELIELLEFVSDTIIQEKLFEEIVNMDSITKARELNKDIQENLRSKDKQAPVYAELVDRILHDDRPIVFENAADVSLVELAIRESNKSLEQKEEDIIRLVEKATQEISKRDQPQGDIQFQEKENQVIYEIINEVSEEIERQRLNEQLELYVDLRSLTLNTAFMFDVRDSWESITTDFIVLDYGEYGSDVSWSSSKENVISFAGSTAVVNRQQRDETVIVTATLTRGNQVVQKSFLLVVKSLAVGGRVEEEHRREVVIESSSEQYKPQAIQRINLKNQANQIVAKIDKIVVDDTIITEEVNGPITIYLPDDPNNIADELAVEVPLSVLEKITDTLLIKTDQGSIMLSKESLEKIRQNGIDLFLRIVPVRNNVEKALIVERMVMTNEFRQAIGEGQEGRMLGTPKEIVTNYIGYETEVTLPLDDVEYTNAEMLRVFIEHTDGENRVVEGELVFDENGYPIGIKFVIDKFSTFSIFEIVQATEDNSEENESTVDEDDTIDEKEVIDKENESPQDNEKTDYDQDVDNKRNELEETDEYSGTDHKDNTRNEKETLDQKNGSSQDNEETDYDQDVDNKLNGSKGTNEYSGTDHEAETGKGEGLPQTATMSYNFLLAGFILISIASAFHIFRWRRKKETV